MGSMTRRTQAAPPDDGHRGSLTPPGEALSVPEADQPKRPPHLHRDIPRHESRPDGKIGVMIVAVVAFALVFTYLALRWLP